MHRRWIREETGSTAIEYGLIASLIGTLLIASITSLGLQVRCTLYSVTSRAFGASVPECGTSESDSGGEGWAAWTDPETGESGSVMTDSF